MPSIGEAFQHSRKEKEQVEEGEFIIEPFLCSKKDNAVFSFFYGDINGRLQENLEGLLK